MIIIILIIMAGIAVIWLSTIRLFNPPHNEWSATSFFSKIDKIYCPGMQDKYFGKWKDDQGKEIEVKIDTKKYENNSYEVTIWPRKKVEFTYRYARFMELKEAKSAGRSIKWTPKPRKDKEGKEIPLQETTMVLAENAEKNKSSLKLYEREEFVLPFVSKDGWTGDTKAYIEFVVYDFENAITSTISFKTDAIKASQALYKSWASEKDYLTEIQPASFDVVKENLKIKGKEFFEILNAGIIGKGVIVHDIHFTEHVLNPESEDILEELEKIKKEELNQKRVEKTIKTKGLDAKGDAEAIKIRAKANAEKIKTEGSANNDVEINLLERKNVAEYELVNNLQEIKLGAANRFFTRKEKFIKKVRPIVDKTSVKEKQALGKLRGVLMYNEANSNKDSSIEHLQDEILGHIIVEKKEEVKDEKK